MLLLLYIGDFNAKVGSNHENVVGKFGLGDCNERGERLIQFCKENQLIVTNTFYEHPMRRRYTWKSPGDRYMNQLDFILVRDRFRNSVKQARSYPGADIASDHNPVLVKLNVKLKKNKTSTKGQSSGIDVNILKTGIADEYNVTFRNRYEGLNVEIADQSNNVEESVENTWSNFICSLQSANEILPKKKRQAKQPWMTDEILLIMEERRKLKRGSTKYKELNVKIDNECRLAKEKWLNDKCEEIEELDKRHLTLQLHKETKNLCGIKKCSTKSGCVKGKDGTIIFEKDKVLDRWVEYVGDLFDDDRPTKPEIADGEGPTILQSEVKTALKEMLNNKAAGLDGIQAEMLKALDDDGIIQLLNPFAKHNLGHRISSVRLARVSFHNTTKKTEGN